MAQRLPEPRPARAPRGVLSPAPVNLGDTTTGAVGREIRKASREIAKTVAELQEERRKRETAKALAGKQKRLNAFREEALLTDDPEVLEQMFSEALPRLEREMLREHPTNEPLQVAIGASVERMRASLVGHRVSVRRRDAIATSEQIAESFATEASQIPLDAAPLHAEAVAQMRDSIDALDGLTPAERAERAGNAARRGAYSFVGGQIDRDPQQALELLDSPEQMRADPLLSALEIGDQEQLRAAARSELSRRKRVAEEQREAAVEAATDAWLPRIYAPIEELPRIDAVLSDPVLPASTKEHFINVIEQRARGKNTNATNEAIANEVYRRIHDESHPRRITSFQQIVPFLGNGLSREDAESFREDLRQLSSSPIAKRQDRLLSEFLRNVEAQIDSSTLFTNDPIGARKFWAFRMEARRRWAQVVTEGRDPVEVLLDPGSREYLGRMVPLYTPSMDESMRSRIEILSPPTALEEAPARREGETPESYLNRIGFP